MKLRKVFLILLVFGAWAPVSGQDANLLKNPGGDEGTEHWRAFNDAKVEPCPTGGRCFTLRSGGYFVQEVAIPKSAVGQYAVLTGRSYSESTTARPYLHGYMMNSGDPSGGRIYAYLSGQQMTRPAGSDGWKQLWGIFRVKQGTGRISFFLHHNTACTGDSDAIARFNDLRLYIFPTEQQARGLVSQLVPWPVFEYAKAGGEVPMCWLPQVEPSLYGIRLGTSLEDVVGLFPEAKEQTSVVRALESAKSRKPPAKIGMVIKNPGGNPSLKEVGLILFHFYNKRLFGITAELHSAKWEDVEEFIEQRGAQLTELDLPPATEWESMEGNPKGGRYLICHGLEIRFYAAPPMSGNQSLVSMVDTRVETTLAATLNSRP